MFRIDTKYDDLINPSTGTYEIELSWTKLEGYLTKKGEIPDLSEKLPVVEVYVQNQA